jgi:hypothetical protein
MRRRSLRFSGVLVVGIHFSSCFSVAAAWAANGLDRFDIEAEALKCSDREAPRCQLVLQQRVVLQYLF